MLKQSIIYLILSILVVMFAKYAHLLLLYFDLLYVLINVKLIPIFSSTPLGIMIRTILTLTLIPIAITSIPALIYRLIKKKSMPYFIEITWVLWLILVLGKILIH